MRHYGRKCRTPLCWFETRESSILGLDMIQQIIEKIKIIKDKLRATQSRKKSYVDKKRQPLEFLEGDHVFLKVTPTPRIGRVMKSKKHTPQFIGLYEIHRKIGHVAYQICLPPFLSNIHNVFHVSQLTKYIFNSSHIIRPYIVQLKVNLTFNAILVQIMYNKVKELRGKQIPQVKVIWNETTGDTTWELEEKIRGIYPHLFL